ncbi:hypothetical protein FRC03_008118 [Tulasnella sp. 419]|nr:hypothetical protein FRC03_008118 [Tulasnella sp. 419]
MRAPVLISLTGLVTCVDISSAAPMIHSETHGALEPRGLLEVLGQLGDDLSRFGKNVYNKFAGVADDVGSTGSWTRKGVEGQPIPDGVKFGDAKQWNDVPTGPPRQGTPEDWLGASGDPSKHALKDSSVLNTALTKKPAGWSAMKVVTVGGALLLVPALGWYALSTPSGNTGSGGEASTDSIDAEKYMRENPSKARELLQTVKGLKDVDPKIVNEMERIANEVDPQAAKRSLLSLD